MNEVLQIFPTIETLCDTTKGRPKSSLKNMKKFYHCPIKTCKYFRNEHYFEKIKFLKQHFVKVHKPKSFPCSKCDKHFPLEATLNRHKLICGVTYRCICKAEYKAYEALLTHVRRKHQGTTLKYKDMMECLKVHNTAQDFRKCFDNTVKIEAIFVEDTSKEKVVCVKSTRNNTASSKETQTSMKMCKILPNVNADMVRSEQEKKTVSMQTSVVCNGRRRKRNKVSENQSIEPSSSLISSGTQTTPIKEEKLVPSSGTFDSRGNLMLDASEYFTDPEIPLKKEKLSSSLRVFDCGDFVDYSSEYLTNPDTMLYRPNDSKSEAVAEENTCTTGTQTNSNVEQSYGYDLLKADSNLIMCSDSETQTVFQDIFDSSYIDTYTQTCDLLLADLDFVDIETQTPWTIFDDKST